MLHKLGEARVGERREGWGVEVEKTSGVLASCPLAAEGTNRSKDLCFQRGQEVGAMKCTRERDGE